MSIGPLGIVGGLAGAPLAQTKGSELERAQQDTSAQARETKTNQTAEQAAGIGLTDGEDHQASDRDADGRRLWEAPAGGGDGTKAEQPPTPRQSKDASGVSGTQLDLSG